jgi:hypothetical protein
MCVARAGVVLAVQVLIAVADVLEQFEAMDTEGVARGAQLAAAQLGQGSVAEARAPRAPAAIGRAHERDLDALLRADSDRAGQQDLVIGVGGHHQQAALRHQPGPSATVRPP